MIEQKNNIVILLQKKNICSIFTHLFDILSTKPPLNVIGLSALTFYPIRHILS